jgi:hypothetical protein
MLVFAQGISSFLNYVMCYLAGVGGNFCYSFPSWLHGLVLRLQDRTKKAVVSIHMRGVRKAIFTSFVALFTVIRAAKAREYRWEIDSNNNIHQSLQVPMTGSDYST